MWVFRGDVRNNLQAFYTRAPLRGSAVLRDRQDESDPLLLGVARLVQHRPGLAGVRLQRRPGPLLALSPVTVSPLSCLLVLLLAHLAEVYGAEVSRQTISTITDSHSGTRVPGGRDPITD